MNETTQTVSPFRISTQIANKAQPKPKPVSYIIKYRNRKLYDFGKKSYVGYIDIFDSIKEGRKIIVKEHKEEKRGKPKRGYETLPDITQSVLIGLIRKFILPKYDNESLTKIIEVSLNKSKE